MKKGTLRSAASAVSLHHGGILKMGLNGIPQIINFVSTKHFLALGSKTVEIALKVGSEG